MVGCATAGAGGGDDDDVVHLPPDSAPPRDSSPFPDSAPPVDSVPFPDSAPSCTPAPGMGTCTANTTYCEVGMLSGQGWYDNSAMPYRAYLATISPGGAPDDVAIELYSGYGVFAGGLGTGTFTITGEELNYATCGVCVRVLTDTNALTYSSGTYVDDYLATSGSVTLTSVNGTIAGSLNNVTLTHVNIDGTTFNSTPAGDGCNSTIVSGSFSAVLSPPP